MDDDTDTGLPPDEAVTEGPATPDPPRPSIEAFVQYRDRVQADNADGGRIGELMLEYANAQPEAVREKLDSDVDTFIAVWDKFAAAIPPRPAPSPPPQAPPPREYHVPAWRRQQIERESRRTNTVLDAAFSIGPGSMPEPGSAQRQEQQKTTAEISSLRRRIRESGGEDRDAEVALAEALGLGNLGRPSWGPSHE